MTTSMNSTGPASESNSVTQPIQVEQAFSGSTPGAPSVAVSGAWQQAATAAAATTNTSSGFVDSVPDSIIDYIKDLIESITGDSVSLSSDPADIDYPNMQRRDDILDLLADGASIGLPAASTAALTIELNRIESELITNAESANDLLDQIETEQQLEESDPTTDRSAEIAALREQIFNDPGLLEGLAATMDEGEYLDLLVELNTNHGGADFPNAVEADALIRSELPADYLAGAIARGAMAEGNLAIVDEANFEAAFRADSRFPSTAIGVNSPTDINGFVDEAGRQWVSEVRGNAGTPIHEALHFYSTPDIGRLSGPLNEGITEHFTLEAVDGHPDAATIKLDRDGIYRANREFAAELVNLVGEDVVAAAYFDGDVEGLKQAYLDNTGRPESDWDDMIANINNVGSLGNQAPLWNAAEALLTPLPITPSRPVTGPF